MVEKLLAECFERDLQIYLHHHMILATLTGKFWLNYSEVSLKKSKTIVPLFLITERIAVSAVVHLSSRRIKYNYKCVYFSVKLRDRTR